MLAEKAEAQGSSYPTVLRIEDRTDMELRLINVDDAPELYGLLAKNQNHLEEYGHLEVKDIDLPHTEQAVRSMLERMKNGGLVQYRIVADGAIVGTTTLHSIDRNSKTALLGYWIGKESTGQGYASVAARRLADYGFNDLGLETIKLEIDADNKPSEQVAKKLGARLVQDDAFRPRKGQQVKYHIWEINHGQ